MSKRNQWRPKVAESTESAEPAENAITGNPTASNPNPPLGANPANSAPTEADLGAQQAVSGGNPPATPPPTPDSANLTDFVSKLSPEQLARVRALAASAGISTGPRRGPNGGLIIEVEVPEEVVEPFTVWAESAGEPLSDFIRKITADSLIAYCFQDWGQAPTGGPTTARPADTMKVPAAGAAGA